MRFNKVRQIFFKEVLDMLRDRRTLFMMVAVPILLYPGLLLFMNSLATSQQAKMEQKTVHVALVNEPEDSPIVEALISEPKVRIVHSRHPEQQVKEGTIHFVIRFPADWLQKLNQKKTAEIELLYDQSNDDATTNLERMHEILNNYKQNLLQSRLNEKAITQEYVKPLEVKEVNLATKRRMGGFIIGRFLPMLMVIMVLLGSLYPSIDMTAGEKERGTLETILTSPATRTEIVLGKFLTVTIISLLTGLLNMGSMMATFAFGIMGNVSDAIQIHIPANFLLIMVVCLIPLAIFFGGVMMAIASFARSFKEAQNLVTPFHLVATMPAMVASVPGIRLEGFWITIPIANVTLLFKELMLGVFQPDHILAVFFVMAFLGAVALFFAIELFGREEVLFGDASSLGLAWKRSNIVAKKLPEQSETWFFTLLALALLLYVAIPLQSRNVISGLLWTELLIFLALPLAFAYYLKLDIKETFRLRIPQPKAWVVTVLLYVGLMLTIGTIVHLQNEIFPVPKELADMMEKFLKSVNQFSLPVALLLIAVLPGICEEITFRGMVLSGFSRSSRPLAAILLTAFLFGVFHLSLHRFLGVFLIGIALSYVVWKYGSIYPAMLLHAMSNGTMAFLVEYPQYDWVGILQMKPSWGMAAVGVAIIFATIKISTPTQKVRQPQDGALASSRH